MSLRTLRQLRELRSSSGALLWLVDLPGESHTEIRWRVRLPPAPHGQRAWAAEVLGQYLDRALKSGGAGTPEGTSVDVSNYTGHLLIRICSPMGLCTRSLQWVMSELIKMPTQAGIRAAEEGADNDIAMRRRKLRTASLHALTCQCFPDDPNKWLLPRIAADHLGNVVANSAASMGDPGRWHLTLVGPGIRERLSSVLGSIEETMPRRVDGAKVCSQPTKQASPMKVAYVAGHPWASIRLAAPQPPVGEELASTSVANAILLERISGPIRHLSYILDSVTDIARGQVMLVGEPRTDRVERLLRALGAQLTKSNGREVSEEEALMGRNRVLLQHAVSLRGTSDIADLLSDAMAAECRGEDVKGLIEKVPVVTAADAQNAARWWLAAERFTGVILLDPSASHLAERLERPLADLARNIPR